MPQTQNVQIRLDSAVMARYSDIAQAKNMPLASYLRTILEEGMVGHGEATEALLHEMTALRQVLEREGGPERFQTAMLLELLLHARGKSNPMEMSSIAGSVKYAGLTPWQGEKIPEPTPYEPPPPPPAPPAPAKRGLFGRR